MQSIIERSLSNYFLGCTHNLATIIFEYIGYYSILNTIINPSIMRITTIKELTNNRTKE